MKLLSVLLQSNLSDTLRENGKINVVYGVIIIIFVGLLAYLVYTDRRISKLEKKK
ncbi:MAG: CcmD family protein [Flavobacteriaceae bacterium]|nr:CcmD family protein [Flavobacteriaceae bacterium]